MKKFKLIFVGLLVCLYGFSQMSIPTPIYDTPPISEAKAKRSLSMFKNWGITYMGVDSFIMSGHTGAGVRVCICDTGLSTHKSYQDRVVGVFNAVDGEAPEDQNGHATHVGGIIAEVAPDAQLMFAKVLSDKGTGTNDWVGEGIRWCADYGADIINLSLGGGGSYNLRKAVEYADNKGVLVIAAVGNDGGMLDVNNIGYPAKYDEAIGVGSIEPDGRTSWFSSSGEEGHIMAAGGKIMSTWLNDEYRILSGTSMATPFVSGVAAIYKSYYGDLHTFRTVAIETAKDMSPSEFDWMTFYGLMQPREMIVETLDPNPDHPLPPRDTTETIVDEPTTPPIRDRNLAWYILGFLCFALIGFGWRALMPKYNP